MHISSPMHESQVSMGTLSISDWLDCALQFLSFIANRSEPSFYIYGL